MRPCLDMELRKEELQKAMKLLFSFWSIQKETEHMNYCMLLIGDEKLNEN